MVKINSIEELLESTTLLTNSLVLEEFPIGNGKALRFILATSNSKRSAGICEERYSERVRWLFVQEYNEGYHGPNVVYDEVIFGPDFRQSLSRHLRRTHFFGDSKSQVVSSTFA
ncbi:Jasmonoyl--L-amino acid synthetase JAR6 [Camellia lanceoleosa]|nr:Jasmonoyl--L-amino acid synthetase JAR6 [Camellia lanceoleosa]